MIIVKPEIITESKLTLTNVPEMDAPLYSMGTTYSLGNQVIFNHRIYESLSAGNTGNQPDISPLFWLDLGATNRYKMFDAVVGSQTMNPMSINVTIRPNVALTAVVLFNVVAASVQVIGSTPGMGVFYDRTIQLQDYSGIDGWFTYFYSPVGERIDSEIAFLDIPSVAGADYQLIIDNGSADAYCGEAVFGQQKLLGLTGFGSSVGIIDYSRKDVDDFGNFQITERRFANKGNFDVLIDSARVAVVKRQLADVRATPVVYIGDENRSETIIYGFYRNFDIVIDGPEKSRCTLDVEGLT